MLLNNWYILKMASRLLRREVQRLVRHRTLVAAKKVNEQKNFISLLHQQILNNLKDSKIDNLYPIGKGIHFIYSDQIHFHRSPDGSSSVRLFLVHPRYLE